MAKREEDYVTMEEVRRYQKEGFGMPPMEVILAQRAADLMESEAAKEAERVDPDCGFRDHSDRDSMRFMSIEDCC